MTVRHATPYLIVSGQAEKAVALYQRALGANVETLQRFGDVDQSCPEARKSLVMHAELRIGDALVMLSDGAGENPPSPGGPVSVALNVDDPDQMRRSFDGLAESGKVVVPIHDAPWGDLFGVVTDELGISWMFACAKKGSAI